MADGPITSISAGIGGLQTTLENVYNTMMGNCGELMGIGQGLAGFGALLYIGFRVWGHLARAEAIDLFPLLRPFGLGLIIALYPGFIGAVNGLLQPTVSGTAALVNDSNAAITLLLQQKEAAIEQSTDWQMFVGPDGSGSESKWEQYSGEAETGVFSGLTNAVKFQLARISYNFRNGVKVVLSEVLQIVYEAAALCINTLRTFELLLMAILGPLVIGLSVYDPFRSVLSAWLGRYINVFLWLPVANIFGSLCGQIQAEMIKIDIAQIQASGSTAFSSTDIAYLIFLIIAIIGYFCVPSITNHIIHVFPSGGGAMLSKVSGGPAAVAAGPEQTTK
ncbi:MAG TPA: conjugative transposon protein TraJ [Puia sp.]|jgi:conjugative transposon TraJ protein|nr:conjugative transposon protein TraJ [Puia sp.]